jgi:hypothetical protein
MAVFNRHACPRALPVRRRAPRAARAEEPRGVNRPYLNASIYQLEALFETFKDDRRQLLHLFTELKRRTGADARDMAARVARRINYLAPDAEDTPDGARQHAPLGAASEAELLERIRTLQAELTRVQGSEETLRRQLAAARRFVTPGAPGASDQIPLSDHARVYLSDGAPDWMVAAARTAFRKQYHPDRYQDEAQRRRAHDVFVEADAIFAKLLAK